MAPPRRPATRVQRQQARKTDRERLFGLTRFPHRMTTGGRIAPTRCVPALVVTQGLGYGRAVVGAVVDPITEAVVGLSRDAYRMFRENDPAFLDLMDADIEWHVPDTLPGGGDLHGPLEVLGFLDTMGRLWEDAYPEPEELLPSGDKLLVLGTWRARARSTGIGVEVPFAHVLQFRDGKLVYFRNYIDAAKVLRSLEETPSG